MFFLLPNSFRNFLAHRPIYTIGNWELGVLLLESGQKVFSSSVMKRSLIRTKGSAPPARSLRARLGLYIVRPSPLANNGSATAVRVHNFETTNHVCCVLCDNQREARLLELRNRLQKKLAAESLLEHQTSIPSRRHCVGQAAREDNICD